MDEETEFNKDCPDHKYLPTILPARKKIVVLGDLHGDYDLTVHSLLLSGTVNQDLKWIEEDTVLVQVGDQIDRCRPTQTKCDKPDTTNNDESSDIKILKLFSELNNQALEKGGAVYSLLGNHEIMNVKGNLNYVSYEGLKEFADGGHDLGDWKKNRREAFAPGSKYAKFLACTRYSSIIIGSFLFVHAGIIPELVDKLNLKSREDLKKINQEVRRWLLGLISKDYVSEIVGSHNYSMFWDRILGNIPPHVSNTNPECENYLNPVLDLFKVGFMVIGHTPQFYEFNEGVNSTCDQKLWRVDHGGSGAFDKYDKKYRKEGKITDLRKAQVLVIEDDKNIKIVS